MHIISQKKRGVAENIRITTTVEMATRTPSRRNFLTPERVEMRYNTILDAFLTADRRRRGHLPFDRVLEIYALYFHSAAAHLRDSELTSFVEQHMMSVDGSLVVDYMQLALALRKRDSAMASDTDPNGYGYAAAPHQSPRPTNIDTRLANTFHDDGGAGYGHDSHDSHERISPITWGSPGMRATSPPPRADGRMGPSAITTTSPHTPSPSKPSGGLGSRRGGEHSRQAAYSPPGHSPQMGGAPYAVMRDAAETEEGGLEALRSLLCALEATDKDQSGRIFSAQLMMMCRMHGVVLSSSMLRTLMSSAEGADGRVDYMAFLHQLAALSAVK